MDDTRDNSIDKTIDETSIRVLTANEIGPLLRGAHDIDRILLALFLQLGVSTGEARSLNVGDFDVSTGMITIRGKRGKVRQLHVESGIPQELLSVLERRNPGEPLLPGLGGGGRLTTRAMQRRLTKLATQVGVPEEVVTPNNLRRTFATAKEHEWGLRKVAVWLGLRAEAADQLVAPKARTSGIRPPSPPPLARDYALIGGRPRTNQERDRRWLEQHQQGRSYARIALEEGLGPAGREIVAKAVQREAKRQGVSTH